MIIPFDFIQNTLYRCTFEYKHSRISRLFGSFARRKEYRKDGFRHPFSRVWNIKLAFNPDSRGVAFWVHGQPYLPGHGCMMIRSALKMISHDLKKRSLGPTTLVFLLILEERTRTGRIERRNHQVHVTMIKSDGWKRTICTSLKRLASSSSFRGG